MDHTQNTARNEAVSLLTHYFALIADRTKLKLTSDNRLEITSIVDRIIDAARAPVPKLEQADPSLTAADNPHLELIEKVFEKLKAIGFDARFEYPGYIAIDTSYGVQYQWGTANDIWEADAFRLPDAIVGQAEHLGAAKELASNIETDIPGDSEDLDLIVEAIRQKMEDESRCICGEPRPCPHIDPEPSRDVMSEMISAFTTDNKFDQDDCARWFKRVTGKDVSPELDDMLKPLTDDEVAAVWRSVEF